MIDCCHHLRSRAHHLWVAIRCRLSRSEALRAVLDGLVPAQHRLAEFGRLSDEQFTALALNLGALNEQFGAMKGETQVLDDVLHDRDQTHAIGAARSVCKNSIELVHASLGVAHTVHEQMVKVDAGLRHTCEMREEFDKSFLKLRTVAMGFRVEAARVGSEFQGVFANVAAAISDIDRRIAASTNDAFRRIEDLLAESEAEQRAVHSAEGGTFAGAQAAIDAVRNDLDALQTMLAPSVAATAAIAAEVDRSGPLVLEVLRALQYQDIVRQRLEHVSHGLADIDGAAARVRGSEFRELAYFGHAARIQSGQLVSSRAEIARAGEEVTRGLSSLLALARDIVHRLDALERAASEALGSDRMAAMFSREIGHLAKIADASERANRRVAGLVERIESVVTVFTGEIEKQVREVKLVALNAQVAAARLPCAGALERLAEETTRISHSNAAISHALAAGLRRTLDCLTGIRGESSEFLEAVATEKAVIESGAVEVGQALRHHGDEVRRLSAEVRRQFGEVQARLQATLESVNFGAEIDACFAPAEEVCRRLQLEAGEDLLEAVPRDGRLEAHASRYTMEEERETHRSAAAAIAGVSVSTEADTIRGIATVPAAAGDIELF